MEETKVEGEDVVRLIEQFLRENGFSKTFSTLQSESQIHWNAVENRQLFLQDIRDGKWDKVLSHAESLVLPQPKAVDLYEHIFLEFVEMGEIEVALRLMRSIPALSHLKTENKSRFMRLMALTKDKTVGALYVGGTTKEKRRAFIAAALEPELDEVPPSRLLSILYDGLRWRRHTGQIEVTRGRKVDVLHPGVSLTSEKSAAQKEDTPASRLIAETRFEEGSHPCYVVFSPNGEYLVTGSSDGFLEVWDPETGKLREDLVYQGVHGMGDGEEEKGDDEDDMGLMQHDDAITCLTFSPDSRYLASACAAGTIKVWEILNGKCLVRMDRAHAKGVTSLRFSRDGQRLLSASSDGLIRIHGLQSRRSLKEFRGHESHVNTAIYGHDEKTILSTSDDGTVRVWDVPSADCIGKERMALTASASIASTLSVLDVISLPQNPEQYLIVTHSPVCFIALSNAKVIRKFSVASPSLSFDGEGDDIVCACISRRGQLLYVADVTNHFSILEGFVDGQNKPNRRIRAHTGRILGMALHPFRPMLATISQDGSMKIWSD
eukprot:TRINITY_DN82259_c0_g1_i1.p1 TRINITY_DN82259_c0_g1~~TRINITY_DN82259_c0_g1_i1.p1  ORF type:complete len:581 (-),score=164.99 TRINITY_DN82259_c0_g1_i1:155-1798(-)